MAECLEELEGKPLGAAAALDALGGPLPEQIKIRTVRQEIENESAHPAVIAAVSTWPEGSGSGATFKELSKLKGGKLEAKIASAAAKICQEEADHGREGAEAVIRGARSCGLDAHTKKTHARKCRKAMPPKARMRNEMFGYPRTDERLQEIEAGKNLVPIRLMDLET